MLWLCVSTAALLIFLAASARAWIVRIYLNFLLNRSLLQRIIFICTSYLGNFFSFYLLLLLLPSALLQVLIYLSLLLQKYSTRRIPGTVPSIWMIHSHSPGRKIRLLFPLPSIFPLILAITVFLTYRHLPETPFTSSVSSFLPYLFSLLA